MNALAKRQKGMLYTGDNLYILHGLNSESVDLIYLDPPFNSKRLYKAPVGSRAAGTAFKDMWTWSDVDESYLESVIDDYPYLVQFIQAIANIHGKAMSAYLTYMTQRLIEMRRVLKSTGSIYLHCDPTASHYLKIVMDRVFGKNNFRNEIVWCYTGPSNTKRWFPRKHDCILFYAKDGKKSRFFPDAVRIDYKHLSVQHRRARKTGIGGRLTRANVEQYRERGKLPEDYWLEGRDKMSPPGRIPSEYTGFRTQKPLALLHRVIDASSNEGDMVLDPFCGCATTMVAAQAMQRNWIGIDLSEVTADLIVQRLSDPNSNKMFTDFVHTRKFPKRTDLKTEKPSENTKERLYKQQKGKCRSCRRAWEIYDLELDHIIPKSKNGADHYENYQLLCPNCNRIKGDRPMEYLMAKIRARNKAMKFKVSFGVEDD